MSKQSIDAVYEKGIFKPVKQTEINIPEGKKVKIIIDTEENSEDLLKQITSIYDGMTEEEIEEIEKIALDRSNF